MNYYPHHIGDYCKDTVHLTLLEDGAYRRMLDVYYATERPLPVSQQAIYRLVRAKTLAEKQAVDIILGEFFLESPLGWRNVRADLEIQRAREDGEANKERRESEKERQRRHRDRRKNLFAGLREHGVTPPWDATVEELQVALSRVTSQVESRESNAHVTPPVTPPVTRDITATPLANSQEPIAKNQELKSKASAARLNGAPHAIPDESPILENLPLREGGEYAVRKSLVAELEPLYPAVDIPATLREMKGWLLLNSERRKTRRGIRRFIGSWLQGEQEKHGG